MFTHFKSTLRRIFRCIAWYETKMVYTDADGTCNYEFTQYKGILWDSAALPF